MLLRTNADVSQEQHAAAEVFRMDRAHNEMPGKRAAKDAREVGLAACLLQGLPCMHCRSFQPMCLAASVPMLCRAAHSQLWGIQRIVPVAHLCNLDDCCKHAGEAPPGEGRKRLHMRARYDGRLVPSQQTGKHQPCLA